MVHPAYAAGVAARYALGAYLGYRGAMALGKRGRRASVNFRSRKRVKRSKTQGRKKRAFGSRNGFATTGQWGRPWTSTFRKRKIGVRRWRRIIIRDTEAKAHYRSVFAANDATLSTPADLTNAVATFQPAFSASPRQFWLTTGGLVDKDFGEAPPTFKDDVILRGGIARVTISPKTQLNSLFIRVYAVWTTPNPNVGRFGNLAGNFTKEYEPSLFPDFQRIGKILYSRSGILKAGDDCFTVTHRFKPQKIDEDVFIGSGSQLYWLIYVANCSQEVVAVQQPLNITYSYNVSFSADAVT